MTADGNEGIYRIRETVPLIGDNFSLGECNDVNLLEKLKEYVTSRSASNKRKYVVGQWCVHRGIGVELIGNGLYDETEAHKLLKRCGDRSDDPYFAGFFGADKIDAKINRLRPPEQVAVNPVRSEGRRATRITDDPLTTTDIKFLSDLIKFINGYDSADFWHNTTIGGHFVTGARLNDPAPPVGSRSGGDYVYRGRYHVAAFSERLEYLRRCKAGV